MILCLEITDDAGKSYYFALPATCKEDALDNLKRRMNINDRHIKVLDVDPIEFMTTHFERDILIGNISSRLLINTVGTELTRRASKEVPVTHSPGVVTDPYSEPDPFKIVDPFKIDDPLPNEDPFKA